MIDEHQVAEENKRVLLEFRQYLEQEEEEEQLIDSIMADVSLYVLDYTAEHLNGSSIDNINAFDVHCFLGDYLIRRMGDCSPESIQRALDSLCLFVGFLEQSAIVDPLDGDEILGVCEEPDRYLLRLEEYRKLLETQDSLGLKQWRESVLDVFGA